MKKCSVCFVVFFLTAAIGFAQNNVSAIGEIDQVARNLAIGIHAKLLEKKAESVYIGQFTFNNAVPLLGDYMSNQLISELTNMLRRNYSIISGQSQAAASFHVSGEIIHTADIIRMYTRIIKQQDRSVEASFTSDFERNEYTLQMIAGSSRSSNARIDIYEPDSMSSPVSYEIGTDLSSAVVMERSLSEGDADYFLLVSQGDGRLLIETTGNTDTTMELYNEEGSRLSSNDDGGSDTNARITYGVREGARYIAVVKGYDSSTTGSYGFRSYIVIRQAMAKDEYETDDEPFQAKLFEFGSPQIRNFHNGDDVDWVKFEITQAGQYIINARGINNNNLDTCLALYDGNLNMMAEDDDGGESYSARLSVNLRTGVYYVKIWCLDDDPDQGYTFNIISDR